MGLGRKVEKISKGERLGGEREEKITNSIMLCFAIAASHASDRCISHELGG